MPKLQPTLLVILLAASAGCQTPNWGRSLLEVFSGVDDCNTHAYEAAQQQSDAAWEGYWRDNPTVNPKMTEAFDGE